MGGITDTDVPSFWAVEQARKGHVLAVSASLWKVWRYEIASKVIEKSY